MQKPVQTFSLREINQKMKEMRPKSSEKLWFEVFINFMILYTLCIQLFNIFRLVQQFSMPILNNLKNRTFLIIISE